MKLLERNQMHETRFSQSSNEFTVNKIKMLATTRSSFTRTDSKLPHLNRSYSSNAKNTKQKLNELDQRLQQLGKKVSDLKLQTRESRRFASFLKQDLGQRELVDIKQKLQTKINLLQKYSKLTRKNDEERTQIIKNDCQKLNDSSIELKNLLYSLSERVDNLQNAMGIYSAKQKHKI